MASPAPRRSPSQRLHVGAAAEPALARRAPDADEADDDDDDDDGLDSLPSSPTSSSVASSAAAARESDAEREWRESLQQLELLLTMVVVPYVGRYFGRKCAYWGALSRSLCTSAGRKLTSRRLGQVHAVEIPRPGRRHQPRSFQGRRRRRGRRAAVNRSLRFLTSNRRTA